MADGQQQNLEAGPGGNSGSDDSSNVNSNAEDVWDEEKLEKAIKTLKEMHIQLRGLRTTIPRLIHPLATKQSSPEALFSEFSKAANAANSEIQDFRKLMNDPESAKVFEQAKKSRAERPSGIKAWKVTDDPDWLTRDE